MEWAIFLQKLTMANKFAVRRNSVHPGLQLFVQNVVLVCAQSASNHGIMNKALHIFLTDWTLNLR